MSNLTATGPAHGVDALWATIIDLNRDLEDARKVAARAYDSGFGDAKSTLPAAQEAARGVEALADRVQSLEAAHSELRVALEAVRGHAIAQDCGRLCDADPTISYREQWGRSEEYVDGLIRQATTRHAVARENAAAAGSVPDAGGGGI